MFSSWFIFSLFLSNHCLATFSCSYFISADFNIYMFAENACVFIVVAAVLLITNCPLRQTQLQKHFLFVLLCPHRGLYIVAVGVSVSSAVEQRGVSLRLEAVACSHHSAKRSVYPAPLCYRIFPGCWTQCIVQPALMNARWANQQSIWSSGPLYASPRRERPPQYFQKQISFLPLISRQTLGFIQLHRHRQPTSIRFTLRSGWILNQSTVEADTCGFTQFLCIRLRQIQTADSNQHRSLQSLHLNNTHLWFFSRIKYYLYSEFS